MPATQWEEAEAECLSADELFEMIFACQVLNTHTIFK